MEAVHRRVVRPILHAHPLAGESAQFSAMALFNFSAIGMWAFLLRYAESKGLSANSVLQTIGFSAIFSVLGSWLAFAVNTWIDRTMAIIASYVVLFLNTLALAILPVTPWAFASEMFVGGFVSSFLMPYILATQSALDSSGRLPVWGLIGGAFGASLGPMVFGSISQHFSYASAFAAVAGVGVIGCTALVIAARYTARTAPSPAAATI